MCVFTVCVYGEMCVSHSPKSNEAKVNINIHVPCWFNAHNAKIYIVSLQLPKGLRFFMENK